MKQSMEATQISFLLRFGVVAGILILSFHLVEALFGTLRKPVHARCTNRLLQDRLTNVLLEFQENPCTDE